MKKILLLLLAGTLLFCSAAFADDVSIDESGNVITGTSNSSGGNLEVVGASGEDGIISSATGTGTLGVYGENINGANTNFGYLGGDTYGVYGENNNGNYGFLGGSTSGIEGSSIVPNNAGVRGRNTHVFGFGVEGIHSVTSNSGRLGTVEYGVYGYSSSGKAGYFQGDVTITGDLSVYGTITGFTETDPEVGTNLLNYLPRWDGSALVQGSIYDNGNVGIGTSTPSEALSVAGTIESTSGGFKFPDGSTMASTSGFDADLVDGQHASDIIAAAADEVRTAISACGTTISTSGSYYVTANLSSTGHCITVTADNVTIDLMGFTLTGDGGVGDYGINIVDVSNVEVKNGTVTNFQRGVISSLGINANSVRAINIRAVANTWQGIYLSTYNNLIKDCTAAENGNSGIYTFDGSIVISSMSHSNTGSGIVAGLGSTVISNTAYNNGITGIYVYHGSTVKGNTSYSNQAEGIFVNPGSTVTDNTVYNNQLWGIYAMENCLITGNTSYSNNRSDTASTGGLHVFHDSLVKGNSLDNNLQNNIYVFGSNNSLEENLATDSTYGIYFNNSDNYAFNNRVSGNTTDYYNIESQKGHDMWEIRACGTTISNPGSYYVTSNLSATGHCITVATDNVTIDLKGFTLTGDGSGVDYGIYINDVSNVEVRNGTVTNFRYGIFALNSSNSTNSNRVISMRSVENTSNGVSLSSYNNLLKDCTLADNGGIGGLAGNGSTVSDNAAYNNQSIGINAGFGSTVVSNAAYNNQSTGITAGSGSTITNNSAYSNQTNGIFGGTGSTITNNTAYNNQYSGISAGSGATITGNTVYNNQSWGIDSGTSSHITGNTVYSNNQSDTVGIAGLKAYNSSFLKNNTLNGNLRYNIFVEGTDNVLEENIITGSTYGIFFDQSGNFYANNRAAGNSTNYAGSVPTGSGDGGGNVSF